MRQLKKSQREVVLEARVFDLGSERRVAVILEPVRLQLRALGLPSSRRIMPYPFLWSIAHPYASQAAMDRPDEWFRSMVKQAGHSLMVTIGQEQQMFYIRLSGDALSWRQMPFAAIYDRMAGAAAGMQTAPIARRGS